MHFGALRRGMLRGGDTLEGAQRPGDFPGRPVDQVGKAALRPCELTFRVRMCVCDSGVDECRRETLGRGGGG